MSLADHALSSSFYLFIYCHLNRIKLEEIKSFVIPWFFLDKGWLGDISVVVGMDNRRKDNHCLFGDREVLSSN